jgi:hypothetical protein
MYVHERRGGKVDYEFWIINFEWKLTPKNRITSIQNP